LARDYRQAPTSEERIAGRYLQLRLAAMKLLAIHTVPVWEEADGSFTYGMEPRDPHPPVIGWANVLVLNLAGRTFKLLATAPEGENE
jgi:hypothetical protein